MIDAPGEPETNSLPRDAPAFAPASTAPAEEAEPTAPAALARPLLPDLQHDVPASPRFVGRKNDIEVNRSPRAPHGRAHFTERSQRLLESPVQLTGGGSLS